MKIETKGARSLILQRANMAFWGACLLWLLHAHYKILAFPYPMECGESSMLMSTRLILQGENPWARAHQPEANNCYGAGYNLLMSALGKLTGRSSLSDQRFFSALFIWMSALLLFSSFRRLGLSQLESAWLALLQYASLLYYSSPLARPDAQGLFFFLAALLWPLLHDSRPQIWYLSGLLACFAALTKLYFALAFPLLFIFLLLNGRWKDLTRLSAAFAVSLGAAIYVIARWGDTYRYSAFAIYFSKNIDYHLDYVLAQLKAYAFQFFIFLLPLLLGLLGTAFKRSKLGPALPWLLFSFISIGVFVVSLGGNYGSYLVYLFHLNLPFVLLSLAALLPSTSEFRAYFPWIFAFQALLLTYEVCPRDPNSNGMAVASMQLMEAEASKSVRVFAPWELSAWQMEQGREVQDAGQRNFYLAALQAAERWPQFFPNCPELEQNLKDREEKEERDLRNGAYDLVLLDQNDLAHQALLAKKYDLLGWTVLPYPQGKVMAVILAYRLKKHLSYIRKKQTMALTSLGKRLDSSCFIKLALPAAQVS